MATSLINGLGGTSGFGENALPRADDSPSLEIDFTSIVPGGIDLFGQTYTSLFLNYNGSVTFGDALEAFSPTAITAATTIPILAPFWGDVDTRGGTVTATPGGTSTGSNLVWYDLDAVNRVFTATWDDVAYYSQHSDKLNAFQLRIIAVGTNGDFDIQFRYEAINWTTGDASGGSGGLGGDVAVAGYSAGDGVNFFQLAQSGNQSGMLGLPNASNVATPGLFTFSVRNGIPVVALFSISVASADKAEGNAGSTAFTFTVTLAGDTSTARSVAYAVAGSGANPAGAADFAGGALPAGTVSFAVGETSKTVTVNVQGDAAVEADEGFTVSLSSPTGGATLGTSTAAGTIRNDDSAAGAQVSITAASADRAEGNVGPTPFTFTLSRTGDISGTHVVNWAVTGSGAAPTNGTDFVGGVLPSGSVTFAPGETSRTLTVNIQGDLVVEADETFTVTISAPAQSTGNQTTSNTGTIPSTGQTLGISLTAPDASSSTSEAVSGLVSRSGGSGTGQYNIAFVIDRSGSTADTFVGKQAIADLNGDGTANTILDAEIAGFEALLASINGLGLGSANIAVISFDSSAAMNISTTASADTNHNGVLDVADALRSLKAGNTTNYEAGLQLAEAFFPATLASNDVLFFLSDGFPDSQTAFADEVNRLLAAKTDIRAFGVGSGASPTALDLVDDGLANNSATIVLDPSQLSSGLLGGGVKLAEIARVELLVNGVVVQTIQPNQLVQTPLGLQYTGTMTGLSASAAEQITARVVATDAATTTVSTTQTLEVAGVAIGTSTATGVVRNDDGTTEICIETASSTLREGHVGATPFTFTVTREGDLSGTHSVKWSVSSIGGAPANAVDFVGGVLPSGTVTFAPGESAKTITVNVQGDTGVELDETFLVSLSSPATVGGGSGNQTTSNSGTIVSTGQTLGISLTAPDASSSTSEAASGLVSRSGGSGTGQYNIAFVVDRSGSTASTFSGAKTVADLNGDGTANTVLDAEIAGFEAVLASINSLGLGSATIAVISFESGAATNLVTTAGADANKNGVLDVVEALRGLKTGGSTNYEAGLQQAEAFYKGAPSGQNVLFFLSDGQPDSTTAYADEVSRLLAAKVGIQAFGVGSGASAGPLDLVDDGLANNTATIVLDPSQLTSGLLGGGVKLAEIARVELLVNGVVVQTIQPNQLVQTPLGLQYTGTLTGLSVSSSEQITARVIATDAAATTIATTQTLEVLSGSTVQLCDDPTAIGTILNDDTEICIETASSTLREGHVGATPFTFTVTREGDLSGTHSVKWSVSSTGGAPANAVDFVGGVLPSGTVTFAPGESAKTITINVQGDTGLELDETFLVSLSSPATVGGAAATRRRRTAARSCRRARRWGSA
ncbi:Calx-beta domain-containing protein [Reyranella sp.]|uniref:Calx-beta domain-containing protein n=1 Tax=Reyranella sp. TaxID=1929291 RepID=UPI0037846FD9